jgi:hypothetical protein
MDFYIFLANKCRATEGGLAHAELRSDSAIQKKSTEGFFEATYAGLEGARSACVAPAGRVSPGKPVTRGMKADCRVKTNGRTRRTSSKRLVQKIEVGAYIDRLAERLYNRS